MFKNGKAAVLVAFALAAAALAGCITDDPTTSERDTTPAGDYTIAVYHWSGAAADITVDATVQYFTV